MPERSILYAIPHCLTKIAATLFLPCCAQYNVTLRGRKSKSSKAFARWYASCSGNAYTTTLHVINSVVTKLSQLTKATKVWRGVYGGVLPKDFWVRNEYNVRGGVEWAFLSATTDSNVAFNYARRTNGAGIVFEFEQGLVDRGADLSSFSQYPHEREILFSPLAGLEVRDTRVEGGTLVVGCRLSVNLTDEATDKIVSKRLKLLREMASGMRTELSAAAAASGAPLPSSLDDARACNVARVISERFTTLLRDGALSFAPESYNVDERFFEAVRSLMMLKKEMLTAVAALPPRALVVTLSTDWSLRLPDRVKTLCDWLRSGPAATTLDLSAAELPLEGSAALGAALRGNPTLLTLKLPRDAKLPIQELSGRNASSICGSQTKLNLSRRKLGAAAGCVLGELLAFNGTLETLDLSFNMLGQRNDIACFAIADALKAEPARLKSISLRANYIANAGGHAIAQAVAQNSIIQDVDLSANEIDDKAVEGLLEVLQRVKPALKLLRLNENLINAAASRDIRVELSFAVPALTVKI